MRRTLSPRVATLLAVLALVAVSFGLNQRFVRGEALVSWDIFSLSAPWRKPVRPWNLLLSDSALWEHCRAVAYARDGAPRWNPHLALGEPTGTFNWPSADYPPAVLLYRTLPAWVAKGVTALLHVALAGVLMFFYLRWRGHGWEAALGGALAYEVSTHLTTFLEFSPVVILAPWAVLTLWGAEAIARKGTVRSSLLMAGGLGLSVLGGFPLFVIFLFAFTPLFALGLARRGTLARTCLLLGLAIVLGLLIGASHLLPMVEEFRAGGRVSGTWETWFDTTARISPRHAALLLFPDIYGSPVRGFNLLAETGMPYTNYVELRLHMGVGVLLLALAGATMRRSRLAAFMVVLAYLLSLPTPLAYPAFRLIPGWSSSSPTRILWIAFLFLPLVVAGGLDRLRREPKTVSWVAGGLLIVVVLAQWELRSASIVSSLVPSLPPSEGDQGELVINFWRYLNPISMFQTIGDDQREGWVLAPLLGSCFVALSLTACAIGSLRRWPSAVRKIARASFIGVITWELLWSGVSFNPTAAPEALFPSTPGIEALRSVCMDEGRPLGRALLDEGTLPNSLLALGIPAVGTYTNLVPGRLQSFLEWGGCPPGGRHRVHPRFLRARLRRLLSVRGVLVAPGVAPTVPEELVLRYRGPDCDVWEDPGALPWARLYPFDAVEVCGEGEALEVLGRADFDLEGCIVVEAATERARELGLPAETSRPIPAAPIAARVQRFSSEAITLSVSAPRGGVLVLSEAYARGWSARDGTGAELELVCVDGLLRGVCLRAGSEGEVVLTYRCPGLVAGRVLSVLGLILCAALFVRGRRVLGIMPTIP